MGMITCPSCGSRVSDYGGRCFVCDAPLPKPGVSKSISSSTQIPPKQSDKSVASPSSTVNQAEKHVSAEPVPKQISKSVAIEEPIPSKHHVKAVSNSRTIPAKQLVKPNSHSEVVHKQVADKHTPDMIKSTVKEPVKTIFPVMIPTETQSDDFQAEYASLKNNSRTSIL